MNQSDVRRIDSVYHVDPLEEIKKLRNLLMDEKYKAQEEIARLEAQVVQARDLNTRLHRRVQRDEGAVARTRLAEIRTGWKEEVARAWDESRLHRQYLDAVAVAPPKTLTTRLLERVGVLEDSDRKQVLDLVEELFRTRRERDEMEDRAVDLGNTAQNLSALAHIACHRLRKAERRAISLAYRQWRFQDHSLFDDGQTPVQDLVEMFGVDAAKQILHERIKQAREERVFGSKEDKWRP